MFGQNCFQESMIEKKPLIEKIKVVDNEIERLYLEFYHSANHTKGGNLHMSEQGVHNARELSIGQIMLLGMQHAITMFGATVLVPILTGLNISVALFTAGVGTLLFHLITKRRVPAYLGSSFAFIVPIKMVVDQKGIPSAQGGIIVAGLIYALVAFVIYMVGPKFVDKLFPPIVTGPVIMVIGLTLAPEAIRMASGNLLVAAIALLAAIIVSVYGRGLLKLIPVMIGLIFGYLAALIMGLIDFTEVGRAAWFGLPNFTVPVVDISAVSLIAPVALVTIVEHVGAIMAISVTIGKGKELASKPGIHRTLLGDGLATSLAGILGGPPNTTYSENTGVLALTKVFDPVVMRIAAGFAIFLSLIPKLGALIATIPQPIIGGISILLFGMIASVGVRTMVENDVDLVKSKNLIIASVILVLGIGGAVLQIGSFQMGSIGLAGLTGLVLNQLLPE